MKNKIVEANICMVISKGFSGLNMNALKYLLPLWISPLTSLGGVWIYVFVFGRVE